MSDLYIVIPNWDRFQHYKSDTKPPWIKLHTSVLHDDEFLKLTVAQRMALIGIWMLYAKSGRKVGVSTVSLSRQLSQRVTKRMLEARNHAGFIEFRSRDALEKLYTQENRREENRTLSKEQRRAPTEFELVREREEQREKSQRGKGWVDNLGAYTGCRYVRGEFALTAKYDPLGTEPPPNGWPHERPTRDEILEALEQEAANV